MSTSERATSSVFLEHLEGSLHCQFVNSALLYKRLKVRITETVIIVIKRIWINNGALGSVSTPKIIDMNDIMDLLPSSS